MRGTLGKELERDLTCSASSQERGSWEPGAVALLERKNCEPQQLGHRFAGSVNRLVGAGGETSAVSFRRQTHWSQVQGWLRQKI